MKLTIETGLRHELGNQIGSKGVFGMAAAYVSLSVSPYSSTWLGRGPSFFTTT
jgi:hypothetical protein